MMPSKYQTQTSEHIADTIKVIKKACRKTTGLKCTDNDLKQAIEDSLDRKKNNAIIARIRGIPVEYLHLMHEMILNRACHSESNS